MPKRDFGNPFGGGAGGPAGKAAFGNPFDAAPAAPPPPARTPQERQKIGADYIAAYLKAGGDKRNLQSTLARVDWNDPQQVEDMRAFVERETGNREAEERAATPALPFRLAGEPMRVLTGGAVDPARMGEVLAGGSGYGVDRARSEAGVIEQIATGIAGAPGQILKVAPAAGALKAIGLGRAAFPAAMGAVGAGEAALTGGDPLKAGVQGLVQGAVAQAIPVPNLARNIVTREAVARGVGGLSNVVSGAVGRGVTGEGTNLQEAGVDFGMGLAMPGGRTEVPGKFGMGRRKIKAEQQALTGIDAEVARLRAAEGVADPMDRPKAPVATMAEASQIKQEFIQQGGDPAKVVSEGRVQALVETGQLPEPKVLPDGTVEAGYDPQAREKGLIEPGAMPAVDAAEAAGVKVVSSGVDKQTGEGYAVGRAPDGQVVEVKAPAQDTVRLYRVEPKVLPPPRDAASAAAWRRALGDKLYEQNESERGRLFGDNPEALKDYGHGEPDRVTYYIDVPREVAEKAGRKAFIGNNPDRPMVEYLLPPELVAKKQTLQPDAPPPPADPAPVKSAPPGDFDVDPATGLPNYLSKVKVTAPKVKPMPRSGEAGAAVNPLALVKGAGEAATDVARTVIRPIGDQVRHYFGPTGEGTAGTGKGGEGDAIAQMGADADVATKRYRAEITPEARAAKVAAQGAPTALGREGKGKRAAADKAMAPVGGDQPAKFWDSHRREWVERDLPATTPHEQAIKDTQQRLLGKTWDTQASYGFTHEVNGVDAPMRPTPGGLGNRSPYQANALGGEITRMGERHPLWRNYVDAVTAKTMRDFPGSDPAKIEAELLKRSEQANARGVDALEGHMASEYTRRIAIPDFIPDQGGKPIAIQEVNALRYVDNLVNKGGEVVGAQLVFGRGKANQVSALRDAAVKAGVPADDFDAAVRSIYGMSADATRPPKRPVVGSKEEIPGKAYNAAASVVRGLARTGSFAFQAPDITMGNQAVLAGIGRNAVNVGKALHNAFNAMLGRGETKWMKGLIDTGAKTPNVRDWSRVEGDQSTASLDLRNAGRAVVELTARTFDEMQESVGGGAITDFGQAMLDKAGKFSAFTRDRLAMRVSAFTDIPQDQVMKVLEGNATQAEVDAFAKRLVDRGTARATGSNVANSQRSRVDQAKLTKFVFAFYRWFSNNVMTSVKVHSEAAKAWKASEGKGLAGLRTKAAVTTELTRFWTYKALNGALANMLAAAVIPGYSDLEDEIKEAKKSPVAYFLKAAAFNAAGGSITNVMTQGGLQLRNTLPGRIYRLTAEPAVKAIEDKVEGKSADIGQKYLDAAERATPLMRLDVGGSNDRKEKKGSATPRRRGRGIGRGG